jgi:hypothetical protein
MDLLLTPRQHVLRRDVAGGTVQADVVVMLHVALDQTPRIFQRQRCSRSKPVAICMIPNPRQFGDLESLSLPTIHRTWPKARLCVPLFLRCTGALTLFGRPNWPKRSSLSKAKARAASVGFNRDDPYKGIGHLFQNGTLSVQHECFDELTAFLQNFDAFCGI